MPRVSARFRSFKFKNDKFFKYYHKVLREIMYQGAQVFALSAYKHVPVDSGMARGSYRARVNAFGTLRPIGVDVIINPVRKVKGKSIKAGAERSQYILKYVNGSYTLVFESKVFHYQLNEFFAIRTVHSSPWESIMKGKIEYDIFMAKALKVGLPKMEQFTEASTISGGHTKGDFYDIPITRTRRKINV